MIKSISPNWDAPDNIHAFTTTRESGFSTGAYQAANFGTHVGDDRDMVDKNRQQLIKSLNLPNHPQFIEQTHSDHVIVLTNTDTQTPIADASFTNHPNLVCAILTADCLPILITNTQGSVVAAIHAGWRGLHTGIIANTLAAMPSNQDFMAWIGPAISQENYPVNQQRYQQFVDLNQYYQTAFQQTGDEQWLMDLSNIAKQQLIENGVKKVYLSQVCTYNCQQQFYSWRRHQTTGRQATLIWMT